MKRKILNRLFILMTACVGSFTAATQITAARMLLYISENKQIDKAAVYELYSRVNYQTIWLQKDNTGNRDLFLNALRQAAATGLREKDYQFDFMESFRNKNFRLYHIQDSLEAEMLITDAALHFYKDMAYGNTRPAFGYDGLKYFPSCVNIPALMAEYISTNSLQLLPLKISGSLPEIAEIENKLGWYYRVTTDSNFMEVKIVSNKLNNTNKPLISKLWQLGLIDTDEVDLPDSMLQKKLSEAQIQFTLVPDGKIGANTLRELNIPVSARMEQLKISINYYRWLNCLVQSQPVITVNLPAAYLKVYSNDRVILEMRMIVGKRSTPTPTLTSTVNEVILYPYWHVPYSIATKEILPILKRNPGYINAGNYQVLNRSGKIMDPYSINWKALGRTDFPYLIRQSTGCDNALGLLKLNFNNPFSVYLHDTNSKTLFKNNRRYYSHGCMRMHKPMELGHLLLKNNSVSIDTLEQKGCLRNQSPITVPADVRMPIVVWYNPAGIDSTGRVLFYEDVYKKFTKAKNN